MSVRRATAPGAGPGPTPPLPLSPDVRLSVERLVVTGYSRLDARRVSDGFSERLGQLAAGRPEGLGARVRSSGSASLAALSVGAGPTPLGVGRAAAEALWREIVREIGG